jgi:hypothetical protein
MNLEDKIDLHTRNLIQENVNKKKIFNHHYLPPFYLFLINKKYANETLINVG